MRSILAFALCLSPAAANAQDVWGWSVLVPSYTGTDTLGLHLRDRMNHADRTGPAQREERRPVAKAPVATFRYAPSRERRAANLARFVERSRAIDPKGADGLAQLFAQGDIIERIRPELAKHGLSVDDVADAYAVWWINAWQASRGLSGDVSDAATASVRRQVTEAMAATPAFRGAGDAAKQEMAESFLIQAVLLAGAVEQSKGNRAQLDAVSRAAVQGAHGMGIDLPAMTLTDDGFVPADQAGAARPRPGGEPVELARR
ncbi:hypothetical protein LZK98_13515 [Sphingomonas cannabina]|uniref:DUF6683 family protein n=1 Tax=Sphingomonas cannabina TaxID=2899123 RepID=UPI001F1997A1|nr:DUF6683 family protein [Sphingomonas cannabina]UIJ44092.1 hypothetical protein LZK98_13515 [Sphingomonas cannabina]